MGVGVGTGVGVGVGGGVEGFSALAMACMSAALKLASAPIPPTFPLMAFCSRTVVMPPLLDEAKAP